MERVLPSLPWHPRVFYADAERKLPCIKYRNRAYRSCFFVYRYRYRTRFSFDMQHLVSNIHVSKKMGTLFRDD